MCVFGKKPQRTKAYLASKYNYGQANDEKQYSFLQCDNHPANPLHAEVQNSPAQGGHKSTALVCDLASPNALGKGG